jgi:hypothetical protein
MDVGPYILLVLLLVCRQIVQGRLWLCFWFRLDLCLLVVPLGQLLGLRLVLLPLSRRSCRLLGRGGPRWRLVRFALPLRFRDHDRTLLRLVLLLGVGLRCLDVDDDLDHLLWFGFRIGSGLQLDGCLALLALGCGRLLRLLGRGRLDNGLLRVGIDDRRRRLPFLLG